MLKLIFKGLVYGFFGMIIYYIMKTLFAFSISFYIINNQSYILDSIANYVFNLYNDITLTVFVANICNSWSNWCFKNEFFKRTGSLTKLQKAMGHS